MCEVHRIEREMEATVSGGFRFRRIPASGTVLVVVVLAVLDDGSFEELFCLATPPPAPSREGCVPAIGKNG